MVKLPSRSEEEGEGRDQAKTVGLLGSAEGWLEVWGHKLKARPVRSCDSAAHSGSRVQVQGGQRVRFFPSGGGQDREE